MRMQVEERDAQLEDMKREHGKAFEDLQYEKKKTLHFDDSKRSLMTELEVSLEKAAIALEDERRLRKDSEKIRDRVSGSLREVSDKFQRSESKIAEHELTLNSLRGEIKELSDTLVSERDVWKNERSSFQVEFRGNSNNHF